MHNFYIADLEPAEKRISNVDWASHDKKDAPWGTTNMNQSLVEFFHHLGTIRIFQAPMILSQMKKIP